MQNFFSENRIIWENGAPPEGGRRGCAPEAAKEAQRCVGDECRGRRQAATRGTMPELPNPKTECAQLTQDENIGRDDIGTLNVPVKIRVEKKEDDPEFRVSKGNVDGGNIANLKRMRAKGFEAFKSENHDAIQMQYFEKMTDYTLAYRIGSIKNRAHAILLKPVLQERVPSLSTKINEFMHANGLSRKFHARMVINSAYRTRAEVESMTNRKSPSYNSLASKDSAHERGNTLDIAFNRFELIDLETNKYRTVTDGKLIDLYRKALSVVLGRMAIAGSLNAREEFGVCYHTSFYFDANTFKEKIDGPKPQPKPSGKKAPKGGKPSKKKKKGE